MIYRSTMGSVRRLFLVDGSNQMYRAYHAIRGLTGPDGRSTNAVYGFVTMMRKLIVDHQPEFIAAAFDLAGPTFRSELAIDYKANRAPMPPDLAEQIPLVHEACEAFGVPILTHERYEADDVIGTLARRATDAGIEVALVTGDKDFYQLVDEHVHVFNPRDEGTWYDSEGVRAKFGVQPSQVVDVLALMGDSIDNIKGVPGIGEKGARDLISTHGSLDALLAAAETVPQKKYREALLAHADAARRSRELVRIHTDVPVPWDLESLRYDGPQRARCYDLFSRLGFRSLVTEFAPTGDSVTRDYAEVSTPQEIDALVASLRAAGAFACALVLDGESAMRCTPIALAFSLGPRQARVLRLASSEGSSAQAAERPPAPPPVADLFTALDDADAQACPPAEGAPPRAIHADAWPRLEALFAEPGLHKIGHDLKLLGSVLSSQQRELRGVSDDTLLASYLVDSTRANHGIEDLALELAGYKMATREDVCGKGVKQIPLSALSTAALVDFAGERADLAGQIAVPLRTSLERDGLLDVYRDLELPLVPVLADLERVGIKVDTGVLAAQSTRVDAELAERSTKIYAFAGIEFNINSPKQLAEVLFDKLQLPVTKRTGKTRTASTSVEVLEELALSHDLPRLILEWRALSKLKGTYIDALPQLVHPTTGRVHTTFNQAVAATGRLSSSDPNLQNIPDPHGTGARDPARVRRRAGLRADLCRLLANRAAGARTPRRRPQPHRGVPRRPGHPRPDGGRGVRRGQRAGPLRAAAAREDHQLRPAVREDGLHAVQGHRRDPAGGAGLHRRLLRGLPRSAALHRPDARAGTRDRRGRARCSGAGARSPSSRAATGRFAPRRSEWP